MIDPIHFILPKNSPAFHPVLTFNPANQKLALVDLSVGNLKLTQDVITDQTALGGYISESLKVAGADLGYGGYLENRAIYNHLPHFNNRSYHLGVDIWASAGTPIFAPWGGSVHSLGYNAQMGDYGATIILQHQLDGLIFYTLYGHLSTGDLGVFGENEYISFGDAFAKIGRPEENGNWYPHLHFQVIFDLELRHGDYPGVCNKAELPFYQNNCPDPDLILNLKKWL